ncbi:uncharacterized protein C8R40DRAFT_1169780 [Lentinula edodes]|uniref:uncharacterized protein n=1 Tax=Lentinula edodes TaxID=5353 RepID=UPI001E8EEDCC|nr:uncharacterized protein C8R40DRAFT_1169780 [Lentinula edodes]KAH7876132.1 hypothetical protein C8R40DRAFT_1169780 [Lentinula edodes]
MSTASLPSYYLAPNLSHTPAYTEEPQEHEQRIALSDRLRSRNSGTFVKQSRNGEARLTLNAQNGPIPTYGSGGIIDGTIDIAKTENITSIDIKVEGHLQVKEIAEGGTIDRKVDLASSVLWSKEEIAPCPSSCDFQLPLPHTFEIEGQHYNLPPTYNVKLSGLPGFVAFIEYSIHAVIRRSTVATALAPRMKASFLGINVGNTYSSVLSTPFIYYPRTRPMVPLPAPIRLTQNRFTGTPDWQLYESVMASRRSSLQDISTRLYIPASRIFCASQNIPFHVTFESSALSLATFLPFGPSGNPSTKKPTRLQIMRKVTVDVRHQLMLGTSKTDMWRVDCLGEATFKHAGDGPTWVSFSGDISIDPPVKVMGFKVGGIAVKDFMLFSMTPPEAQQAPFSELRQVIPIQLTTDVWSSNGNSFGTDLPSESVLSLRSS